MNARLVIAVLFVGVVLEAQERIDHATYWKIRQEATSNSQILKTVQVLTDVYGPRPTGSPNLRSAGEWAVRQLESWGLQNGSLEPWDWGNPGWVNERLSLHVISPVKDHLVAEALGWTPGTNGPVRGAAVQITLPTRPTEEELAAHLDGLRRPFGERSFVGASAGAREVNDPPERRDDREVLQTSTRRSRRNPAARSTAQPPRHRGVPDRQQPAREVLTRPGSPNKSMSFFGNGARARVNDAGRTGQIRAFANNTYDPGKAVPTVVLRTEDTAYLRLLAYGQPVELELDVVNRITRRRTSYNTIAEIRRTDEVVMLGATWTPGMRPPALPTTRSGAPS